MGINKQIHKRTNKYKLFKKYKDLELKRYLKLVEIVEKQYNKNKDKNYKRFINTVIYGR
jgi:hypothetical protein